MSTKKQLDKEPNESGRNEKQEQRENPAHCGIIMPIADMPGYEPAHWGRVQVMISEAIEAAGYVPRLVSDSDEVQVIHTNIVQNIHDDEIIVCDVSGKNANVMFELGLRLAFDKPVIIVKDNATEYSFDTSPIKHIGYRKDLRFDDVLIFKDKVSSAIKSTVRAKEVDENYSPFLKNFRHITAKKLGNEEVTQLDFLIRKMDSMQSLLEGFSTQRHIDSAINARLKAFTSEASSLSPSNFKVTLDRLSSQMMADIDIEVDVMGRNPSDPTFSKLRQILGDALVRKAATQYPEISKEILNRTFDSCWREYMKEYHKSQSDENRR